MAKGDNIDKAAIALARMEIRSARAIVERREAAILLARKDIRAALERIRVAQNGIEQLGGTVRR